MDENIKMLLTKGVMYMTGREERDIKNKKWLEERMSTAPRPLQDFMQSFARKETTSQKVYFGYLMNFLNFIKNHKQIDIENYNSYSNIRKMDIDAYMNYTEISSATGKKCGASIRNSKLIAVSTFFDFLVDNDIINKNPCRNVSKIKETKEKTVTYLTKEEITEVSDKIIAGKRNTENDELWRLRDLAIFMLGCTTGMRKSAICEINMDDLNLEKREVVVTEKGNVTKTIFLSKQTCKDIQQWLVAREKLLGNKACEALFISNRRERIGATGIKNIVKTYTQDIGKHITPHKLRSTCAMNLYEATGDIYLVAQQLGHKNIENTQIYAKATKKKMKETADLMDKIYE